MPQREALQLQQPQAPQRRQQPRPQQLQRLLAVLRWWLLLHKRLLRQQARQHHNLQPLKHREVPAIVALAMTTQVCSNNV